MIGLPNGSGGETIVALEGASEIPAEAWDGLARRGFQSHRWHVLAERCGWPPRHLVLGDGRETRSVVPAYLTGAATLHDLHDRWLGPLGRIERLGIALRPVLSVQSPFAQVSEPLGRQTALSPAVLHQVFERLEAIAERDRARAVAWPFVEADDEVLLGVARERGYLAVYAGATARLRVEWSSFDDYLAARGKGVRRTIRSDLQALAAAGLRCTAQTDFRHEAAAYDTLYRSFYRRRNGVPARLASDFFALAAAQPTPGLVAQLTWSGERLVGASLNLAAGSVLEGTFAAFAPEHRRGPAYYNDLVYEPLRRACRDGIGVLDLGSTALYAKVLRGARLRRRMTLLRGLTSATHGLLRVLGAAVSRRVEWKERRALGALWGPGVYQDGQA